MGPSPLVWRLASTGLRARPVQLLSPNLLRCHRAGRAEAVPVVLPHSRILSQTRSFASVTSRAGSGQDGNESNRARNRTIWPWAASAAIVLTLSSARLRGVYAQESNPESQDKKNGETEEKDKKADEPNFAPSIDELEAEELRRDRNALVRAFFKVFDTLQQYVFEPIGTTTRFIVLVCLFLPVIIAMPMLIVGRRREGGRRRGRRMAKKEGGERWGAIWWYGFLVKQMERAGPTFIKVSVLRELQGDRESF